MMSSRSPIARLRGGRLSLLAAGSEHMRLASEATRHIADQNYHRAAKAHRTAIALEPGEPMPYFSRRAALGSAGRPAEAVPRFLQAAALSSEG